MKDKKETNTNVINTSEEYKNIPISKFTLIFIFLSLFIPIIFILGAIFSNTFLGFDIGNSIALLTAGAAISGILYNNHRNENRNEKQIWNAGNRLDKQLTEQSENLEKQFNHSRDELTKQFAKQDKDKKKYNENFMESLILILKKDCASQLSFLKRNPKYETSEKYDTFILAHATIMVQFSCIKFN